MYVCFFLQVTHSFVGRTIFFSTVNMIFANSRIIIHVETIVHPMTAQINMLYIARHEIVICSATKMGQKQKDANTLVYN